MSKTSFTTSYRKAYALYLFSLLIVCSCGSKKNENTDAKVLEHNRSSGLVISFGSCSDEDKKQKLWDDIIAENPDAWIWLGDNIYGDTQNMEIMRSKYDKQKAHAGYQQIMQNSVILGTWDDHDYGVNDGGKEFIAKEESQKAFLDFFDVAEDSPRRTQEGIYHSHTIRDSVAKVKVILLDTRYFRDPLKKEGGKNVANMEGTILGETQWTWLKGELENSSADVHIIASSIQAIPEEHIYEKWQNFPAERERLFDLITETKTKKPIIISGDRHIGEISKIDWKGNIIYDITSSSLTHGWSQERPESNEHRVGPLVYAENFGILEIEHVNGKHKINSRIMSNERNVESEHVLDFEK